MTHARRALALSVGSMALTLGGCGGGGARPQPSPPPPVAAPAPVPTPVPPPPPPAPPPPSAVAPAPAINYDDAEYRRSGVATSSGALSAWNTGATGRGVDVAVIDSGINPNLPEFAGRVAPGSRDLVAARGVADSEGHGTAVSAVIAAARNGNGTLGVAFDARILSLNSSDPANCEGDDGCRHSDRAIALGIDTARTSGARVINISLGGEGAGAAVLQAVQRAAAAGILVVVSAGNDGAPAPTAFAIALSGAGGANVIIAGSVGVAGAGGIDTSQISDFSNQAGAASPRYLTALGYRVTAPNETGVYYSWSGTSFSAPVISGAAALLASAFPNLTGAQIAELLLGSADDIGAAGADATFGRGRLNIARAFAPQGPIRAAGSSAAPVSPVGNGSTSGPMGDAEGGLPGMVVLDGFDRAYALQLAQTLSRAPAERPLAEALQPGLSTSHAAAGTTSVSLTVRRNLTGQSQIERVQSGLSPAEAQRARVMAVHAITRLTPQTAVAFGLSESAHILRQRLDARGGSAFLIARDPAQRTGFAASDVNSVGVRHDIGAVAITATGESGAVERLGTAPDRRRDTYDSFAITADRSFGRAHASLGVTRLQEQATILGGRFDFAPAGSTSTFLDGSLSYDFGRGWGTQARVRTGWTALPGGNGLVQGGGFSSDAWSLDLWRHSLLASGDALSFRIAQPLRVRSGGYLLNLPTAYDYADGSVGYSLSTFNLAPRGREIDFEAAYRVPLFQGAGSLSTHAFLRRQPGHVEAAPTDVGAAVRFSLDF